MGVTRGFGPNLLLQLRSQYQERSGVELCPEGAFNDATNWTLAGTWTISAGAAHIAGGAGATLIQTVGTLAVGRTFWLRIKINAIGAGQVRVLAGTTTGTWRAAAGEHEETLVCAANTSVGIEAAAGTTADIEYVMAQEVLQKTADDSDYCSDMTLFCSERGGVAERATISLLENVDRHTGVVTTVSVTAPGPSGWSYQCGLDGANTHSGKIPRLTIVTQFAQGGTTVDFTALDDSRGHVFFEQSTLRWVLEVRGKGRIQSLACTFPIGASIVLTIDIDEATNLMTLIVSGCTTGNGTFQTYAAPKRAMTVGDGYTAAGMPTQAAPRGGVTTDAGTMFYGSLTKFSAFGLSGTVIWEGNWNLGTPAGRSLIQIGSGNAWQTGGLLLYAANTAAISLYWGALASVISSAAGDLTNGFHSVAGVSAAGVLSVYLDGRLIAGPSGAVATSTYRSDLLCAGDSGGTYVNSYEIVRGIKVFPYALTATQLRALHEAAQLESNR